MKKLFPFMALMMVLGASLSMSVAAQCPQPTHFLDASFNSMSVEPVSGSVDVCGDVPFWIDHFAVIQFNSTIGPDVMASASGSDSIFMVWMDAACNVIHSYGSGDSWVGDTVVVNTALNHAIIGTDGSSAFVFAWAALPGAPLSQSANLLCLPLGNDRPSELSTPERYYDLLGREASVPLSSGVYGTSHGRRLVVGI